MRIWSSPRGWPGGCLSLVVQFSQLLMRMSIAPVCCTDAPQKTGPAPSLRGVCPRFRTFIEPFELIIFDEERSPLLKKAHRDKQPHLVEPLDNTPLESLEGAGSNPYRIAPLQARLGRERGAALDEPVDLPPVPGQLPAVGHRQPA